MAVIRNSSSLNQTPVLTSKSSPEKSTKTQEVALKSLPEKQEITSLLSKKQVSTAVTQLELNLSLGQTINDYTQEKVPIILNYLERRDIDYEAESQKCGYEISMVNFKQLASMAFEMIYTPVACSEYTTQNIQKIAAVAKKHGIGTCLEMSAVALDYCIENRVSQRAEIFYLEGGNHVFLVLGRDPKSTPSNYEEWGSNAVICDTWSGKVFPSSEIDSNLKNFVKLKTVGTHISTILEPFDPKKHVPQLLKNY